MFLSQRGLLWPHSNVTSQGISYLILLFHWVCNIHQDGKPICLFISLFSMWAPHFPVQCKFYEDRPCGTCPLSCTRSLSGYSICLIDQRQKQILLCLGEEYRILRLLSLPLPNITTSSSRSGFFFFFGRLPAELLRHLQTTWLSFRLYNMNTRSPPCIPSLPYQIDIPWFPEEFPFLSRRTQCQQGC